jgi:hypothetical protein
MVNPSMLGTPPVPTEELQAGKITVRPNRSILPGHLWIGTEDKI